MQHLTLATEKIKHRRSVSNGENKTEEISCRYQALRHTESSSNYSNNITPRGRKNTHEESPDACIWLIDGDNASCLPEASGRHQAIVPHQGSVLEMVLGDGTKGWGGGGNEDVKVACYMCYTLFGERPYNSKKLVRCLEWDIEKFGLLSPLPTIRHLWASSESRIGLLLQETSCRVFRETYI